MFYSQFILAKKGPLGTIWIAAHLERKLRKNQVADTDIAVSVDSILFPEMPIALRLSSHLLLGVVRIYSKKVNYLFDDCSEALLKVKQAFRSTAVDLPPEESTAPYHSITLPETFDLDDFELPDNDLEGNYVDQHISSKDQITLQDTMEGVVYSTSKFGLDERFGDGDASGLDLDEELLVEKAATPDLATGTLNSDNDPQASDHANASGILNQDLDDYDGDNEPVDYAEGPCTPGLWEEPNLSNIQEMSACDDHHEPENHTITEFAVKENLENTPHQHHHNQSESHEKSLPQVAATEQMLISDLGSTPFTESHLAKTVIPVSNDPVEEENLPSKNVGDGPPGFRIANDNRENFVEYQGNQNPGVQMLISDLGSTPFTESHLAKTVIPVSNDPVEEEHLPSKNVGDGPPGFRIANDNRENFVEYQGNQNPGVQSANETFVQHQGNQENAFHRAAELESNTEKDNLVSTPQHHASLGPKDSNPLLFNHASMPNSDYPIIRPCVTFPNHESSGPHSTESLNNNFPEIHYAKSGQNHEVRVDNAIQREVQVENINSYTNDIPAPVIQRGVQVENINSYTNDFSAPVIQREAQVENINSYTNDIPAPVIQRGVQVENINSYTNDFSAPVIQREVQVENITSYTNDFSAPVIQREVQVENINSYTNDSSAPVIRRDVQAENINSYTNDSSAPVIQREVQAEIVHSYTNDFPAPVIQREVQAENVHSYTNDFPAPVIQREVQAENVHSYTNDFPAPVIQREVQAENVHSYTNDFPAPVIQREVQAENVHSYTNDFPAPVIQREVQVENINSYTNDFPAPEKRLSLPHWLSDVPKSLVPESTPIEKDTTAGKKRTFTDSSMTAHSLNLNESSQSFNLNQSAGLFTTNTTAQSLNLNESSGFFTTNTTAHSVNLTQSSGSFTKNMTGQSVTNNDDLLSSILVGRKSSVLKFKPTPPAVTPSTKRRRSTPKTSVMKRKVLMDDTMVLHGDTIRQQLTNTEDIRRLRKKAPCTRSEISMLEKQFWEDELFSEPTFTGVSIKLASLHNQLYNLSKIVVSHNDASLRGEKDPKSISQNVEKGIQLEVGSNVPKEIANVDHIAEPTELPMARDPKSISQNVEKGIQLEVGSNVPKEIANVDHIAEPTELPMARDPKSISQNVEKGIQLEVGSSVPKEIANVDHTARPTELPMVRDAKSISQNVEKDIQLEVGSSVPKEIADVDHIAQSTELPMVRDPKSVSQNVEREIQPEVGSSVPKEIANVDHIAWPTELPMVRDPKSVSQNVEKDIQLEVGSSVHKEIADVDHIAQSTELPMVRDPKSVSENVERDIQPEVGSGVPKEIANVDHIAQPTELPTTGDNHAHDNNTVNLDYYGSQPPQMVATEHVAEPFNSEHDLFGQNNAMEIDPQSFPDSDVGVSVIPTEVEPPTLADVVLADTFDLSAPMGEVQTDASLQTDVPVVSSSEKIDLQSFDLDINANKAIESTVASEMQIDVAPVREISVEKQDQDIEFRKNEEVVNEDAALTSNAESNAHNSVYNGIFGEEFGTVGAYDTEVNPVLDNVSLDERENPDREVTFETTEMNVEDTPASNRVEDDKSTHPAVENNTDFLNFNDSDNDEAGAGGDYAPDVEATGVIDNSGWSSRTKAVAKYLQMMFDKEEERGRNMVTVNNLLVGKTRKEASRMFFETLVLKTKDYIHVEQADPFGNINVFPRAKLLKSNF